jgi:hypothetical protein
LQQDAAEGGPQIVEPVPLHFVGPVVSEEVGLGVVLDAVRPGSLPLARIMLWMLQGVEGRVAAAAPRRP